MVQELKSLKGTDKFRIAKFDFILRFVVQCRCTMKRETPNTLN